MYYTFCSFWILKNTSLRWKILISFLSYAFPATKLLLIHPHLSTPSSVIISIILQSNNLQSNNSNNNIDLMMSNRKF